MKSTSVITAGVDIGYGSVKAVCGELGGPALTEFLMPAGALPARFAPKVSGVADLKGGEEVLLDNPVLDGLGEVIQLKEAWVAGIEPAEVTRVVRQLNDSYPLTDEYLALYRGALARLRQPRIDLLITGLPTSHFYGGHGKELIQSMVQRMSGAHQVNATTVVEVKRVAVIPQPLGAFMGVACQPQHGKLLKEPVPSLVADPGFFSLDWCALSGRAIIESSSGSNPKATSLILEQAAIAMSEHYDRAITRDDLDRALRRGAAHVQLNYTDRAAFAPFIAAAAKTVSAEGVADMRAKLRDHGRIDLVILTGGGAGLYAEAVQAAWPKATLMTLDDPCFGNVRGYRATAELALAPRSSAQAA